MIPSAFVVMDEWPLNSNGKLDRKALPDPDQQQSNQAHQQPFLPLELLISGIYFSLSHVPLSDRHQNFFQQGFNSLQVIRFISLLNPHLSSPLTSLHIFQHPNLFSLSQFVSSSSSSSLPPPLPFISIPGPSSHPPIWFFPPSPGLPGLYLPSLQRVSIGFTCNLLFFPQWVSRGSLSTLEEVIEYFISVIVEHQSGQGPFYLCGWSLGGQVAIQVAERLEKQLAQLETFVFLLDTVHPSLFPDLSNDEQRSAQPQSQQPQPPPTLDEEQTMIWTEINKFYFEQVVKWMPSSFTFKVVLFNSTTITTTTTTTHFG